MFLVGSQNYLRSIDILIFDGIPIHFIHGNFNCNNNLNPNLF